MAKEDDLARTSEMTITIKVGDVLSEKKFKLYAGTEMVYAQGVDLAVTKALGMISKVAFDIITDDGTVPANVLLEAGFGKAVQDAG